MSGQMKAMGVTDPYPSSIPKAAPMMGFEIPPLVVSKIISFISVAGLPVVRRLGLLFHAVLARTLSRDNVLRSTLDSHLDSKRASSKRVWVFVRARPFKDGPGCVRIDRNQVRISGAGTSAGYECLVDRAFSGDSSQAEVCDYITSRTLHHALNGEHICLLAYGQTGSGKTHTMFGPLEDTQNQGLAFRAVAELANLLRKGNATGLSIDFSFLEVYNDELYDCLDSGKKLPKQRSSEKHAVPTGLTRRQCTLANMEKQVSAWLGEGAAARTVGRTVFNPRSSRSHGVVLIHLSRRSNSTDQAGRTANRLISATSAIRDIPDNKIYIVDLAGSERSGLYATDKDQLKEGEYINLSLSALGRVVGALASGKCKHVPYRDSALTWLLKDAITGTEARACLVAAVHPRHAVESVSTLRYAHQYSAMQTTSGIRIPELTADCREQKRKVDNLKVAFQKALDGDEYGIAWTLESLSGTVQPTKKAREIIDEHPFLTWTAAHQTKWAVRGQRRDKSGVGRTRASADVPEPRGINDPPDGRLALDVFTAALKMLEETAGRADRCVEVVFEGRHGRPAVALWYPSEALEEVFPPKSLLDAKTALERAEEDLARKKSELKAAQDSCMKERKEWMARDN